MRAKILIIEDERELNDLLALYLREEGATVDQVFTAEEGEKLFLANQYDLTLLDLNLPGKDGFEFLSDVRREKPAAQVMVVSARESDEDIIMALGFGADHYLSKPFSPSVLTARIRALLRAASRLTAETADSHETVIRFGPYELQPDAYILTRDGKSVPLSNREFEVLNCLARHIGKPLRSETIYEEVWEVEYGDITAVGTYIRRLRRKLEADDTNPRYLLTVHGRGYRLVDPGGGDDGKA